MTYSKEPGDLKRKEIRCQRCGGRMIVEKFYDVNNVFWGWHCVICGEILDPVILLHRLSQDADLRIPENENEMLDMLKKYLQKGNNGLKGQKIESKMSN
jgi:ribosomal protein S27AE